MCNILFLWVLYKHIKEIFNKNFTIQSFINNKQRIYTSVLLVTLRNSDYGKLARLNLNILILNITRIKLSETQAVPAPLQTFRKYVSCEYMFLPIHSKHGLFSFLYVL